MAPEEARSSSTPADVKGWRLRPRRVADDDEDDGKPQPPKEAPPPPAPKPKTDDKDKKPVEPKPKTAAEDHKDLKRARNDQWEDDPFGDKEKDKQSTAASSSTGSKEKEKDKDKAGNGDKGNNKWWQWPQEDNQQWSKDWDKGGSQQNKAGGGGGGRGRRGRGAGAGEEDAVGGTNMTEHLSLLYRMSLNSQQQLRTLVGSTTTTWLLRADHPVVVAALAAGAAYDGQVKASRRDAQVPTPMGSPHIHVFMALIEAAVATDPWKAPPEVRTLLRAALEVFQEASPDAVAKVISVFRVKATFQREGKQSTVKIAIGWDPLPPLVIAALEGPGLAYAMRKGLELFLESEGAEVKRGSAPASALERVAETNLRHLKKQTHEDWK